MNPNYSLSIAFGLLCLSLAGCEPDTPTTDIDEQDVANGNVVWAVNVGGAAYEGVDGTVYEAESSVRGGEVGTLEKVKGSNIDLNLKKEKVSKQNSNQKYSNH